MINASSPVWHPFTQHRLDPVTTRVVRTEGAYLIDDKGRAILDLISSWWVVTHGHRHPLIMEAIRRATEQFDQIIFAEYSHEPAEQLARGLISLAPPGFAAPGLAHVFYSDSGSTSVEVAIKMALGVFHNRARSQKSSGRSRILVMEHSYHGDTIGTMSVGERGIFNAAYSPLLFEVDSLPFPYPGKEQLCFDRCEALCRRGDVAALLVEPLILGAGGMKIYPAHILSELRKITQHYKVFLIADEVMTGWGRTGTLLACEQANIAPDILCLSKGITGGALPLAATLCTSEIFEAHLSEDRSYSFFHSSSYTANPIACAAGVANLKVWETEPVRERIKTLAQWQSERLKAFADDLRFSHVRQLGTITALDVRGETGYFAAVGPKLRAFFREQNLLIRPLGSVIYLMPPYCVTEQELDKAYLAIDRAADFLKNQCL